jgi:hypothetical protein
MTRGEGRRGLADHLAELARIPEGEVVTLAGVLTRLGERGHALLAFILVVPFLQPVPLPGFSTVAGIAVALVGLQLALGRPPWLPRRVGERPIPHPTFVRIVGAAERLFRRFERLIKPRLPFLHEHPGMQRLSGVVLVVTGALLSLPLPIPVSNFLPAFTIALLALGTLEEDGLLVAAGYVALLVTLAFFALLVLLPWLGVKAMA